MKNKFYYFKKPVKVLRVFEDSKFSFSGFLYYKILTSEKYFQCVKNIHVNFHTRIVKLGMKFNKLNFVKSVFFLKKHKLPLWCNG